MRLIPALFALLSSAFVARGIHVESKSPEPTLVETLKSGKAVWEKSLTGELVEKGEKEMAKNLKDGKAESWESIEKALKGSRPPPGRSSKSKSKASTREEKKGLTNQLQQQEQRQGTRP